MPNYIIKTDLKRMYQSSKSHCYLKLLIATELIVNKSIITKTGINTATIEPVFFMK